MLASLGIIFLSGLLAAAIFKKLRLPRILGMLTVGVLFGSHVLNIIDPSLLAISADLRKMALVIILIKAGLSLDIRDLKKVGRPALLMSFLPALFEITAFTLVSPLVLGISRIEGAVIGSILGAVSPAVVVPKMVQLMEDKYGTDKSIPQLILAGASLDDVFNIVLFSTFAAMAQGGEVSAVSFVNIPVSIVSGIIVGTAVGFAVTYFFEICLKKNMKIRSSTKVIVLLAVSFLLTALENALADIVSFSGLLSVISMSCVVGMKSDKIVSGRLKDKIGKLWIAAEVLLFVLVGAAVDIHYTLSAGAGVVAMIFISLAFRCVGVMLCMLGTKLNVKERIFCVIAYLPKATVQAAIGSVPLAMGLSIGNMALSTAVAAIIITAPLGAFGMEVTYKRLLHKETEK